MPVITVVPKAGARLGHLFGLAVCEYCIAVRLPSKTLGLILNPSLTIFNPDHSTKVRQTLQRGVRGICRCHSVCNGCSNCVRRGNASSGSGHRMPPG